MNTVQPLLAKFERSIVLTEAERSALSELPFVVSTLGAGDAPGWTGDRPSRSFVVLEGLLGTSKTLRDGEVQVTGFHIAGDMLGLQALHLEVLDSDISALTPCTVAFIENSDLRALCEAHPRIASLLWRATLVDGAVSREWVVNMAQRSALSRVAHVFCEMVTRLDAVGLVKDGSCALALTQQDLSEAMGLSTVHINRTLQELRARGLLTFGQGRLTVHDWDGLARVGDFRSDYLHMREPARAL